MIDKQISENELALLIGESFNTLPEPDHKRLLIIEQNLERPRRNRNWRPWWIAGLILAGTAAAGWGIYQLVVLDHEPAAEYSDTTPAPTQYSPLTEEKQQGKNNSGTPVYENKTGIQGPVIYRR